MAAPLTRAPLQPETVVERNIEPVPSSPSNTSRFADVALSALRIVSGFMFTQHGVQKHFGLLLPPGSPSLGTLEPLSILWIAGALELAGGLLLVLGLFTRPVAFLLSGMMAFAYLLGHARNGFWPALNGGELAALYCFVFLAISAVGGGRFSLDRVVRWRRPAFVKARP